MLGEGGADVATLDAVMREAGGFRMGPFELMDLIGHDVNFAVTRSVYDAFFQDPRFTPSLLQRELVGGRLPRPQERPRLLSLRRRTWSGRQPGTHRRDPGRHGWCGGGLGAAGSIVAALESSRHRRAAGASRGDGGSTSTGG